MRRGQDLVAPGWAHCSHHGQRLPGYTHPSSPDLGHVRDTGGVGGATVGLGVSAAQLAPAPATLPPILSSLVLLLSLSGPEIKLKGPLQQFQWIGCFLFLI